jgi:hypothetical protein
MSVELYFWQRSTELKLLLGVWFTVACHFYKVIGALIATNVQ